MFAKADLDDDGFVTADDFYNMMTHRIYWDSVKWYYFIYLFILSLSFDNHDNSKNFYELMNNCIRSKVLLFIIAILY